MLQEEPVQRLCGGGDQQGLPGRGVPPHRRQRGAQFLQLQRLMGPDIGNSLPVGGQKNAVLRTGSDDATGEAKAFQRPEERGNRPLVVP